MTFGAAVGSGFRQYATFSGRASRAEYWWWALFVFCAHLAAGVVGFALAAGQDATDVANGLDGLVTLALLLPNAAMLVRRLHDSDRSGWWAGAFYLLIGVVLLMVAGVTATMPDGENLGAAAVFLLLLMVVASLALVVLAFVCLAFTLTAGTPWPNRYGPPTTAPRATYGALPAYGAPFGGDWQSAAGHGSVHPAFAQPYGVHPQTGYPQAAYPPAPSQPGYPQASPYVPQPPQGYPPQGQPPQSYPSQGYPSQTQPPAAPWPPPDAAPGPGDGSAGQTWPPLPG